MNVCCPRCHARYELPESKKGKRAVCEACGRTFVVKAAADPAEPEKTLPAAVREAGSGEAFFRQLALLIQSRHPFIHAITIEEERAISLIRKLAKTLSAAVVAWDYDLGFSNLSGETKFRQTDNPLEALGRIDGFPENTVVVLKDFHMFLDNKAVIRKLRSVAQNLKFKLLTMILLSPPGKLPDELQDESVSLELGLPAAADLGEALDELLRNPKLTNRLTPPEKEHMLQAAQGLSYNQAQHAFAKAAVSVGALGPECLDLIIADKKQIIKSSGALQYFQTNETLGSVGGLHALKKWLKLRSGGFSSEAAEYGLPAPKGIALIGIPGTGKSLTAKAVAGIWKLPLIRMDVGALYGSYVGESEANTRKAIQLAETVAPCILWIDEIEKCMGGTSGRGIGYGSELSGRMMSTILSWMQEKEKPVFVIATANNIEDIPPELLRKGRFDEVFFLDLPNREERMEIFNIQFLKHRRQPEQFDMKRLVDASSTFVGAEIEQAIIDAMFNAFNESPRREINTEDVLHSLKHLIPLSHSNRERIDFLRRWLKEGRAKSATYEEYRDTTKPIGFGGPV